MVSPNFRPDLDKKILYLQNEIRKSLSRERIMLYCLRELEKQHPNELPGLMHSIAKEFHNQGVELADNSINEYKQAGIIT